MTGTTPIDTILEGDALTKLKELPGESVDCCITSPPYLGLRDYGVDGQIGLEESPEAYVNKLVEVFREVRRVLKKEGTLWLNLGDSYASSGTMDGVSCKSTLNGGKGVGPNEKVKQPMGRAPTPKNCKPKDLIGVPWMVAFALRADGWYLRSDIIWHKPNCMPESCKDRPTKSHEYIFLLSKSQKYYYDSTAILEPLAGPLHAPGNKPKFSEVKRNDFGTDRMQAIWGNPSGRNKRTVWTVATKPYSEAHFATFPEKLIEPCILAGCPEGGIVLDPFFGAGTTGLVAKKVGRCFVGIELNPRYIGMAQKRIAAVPARLDRWAEADA
jgi:DNA modification methylase